MKKENLVLKLMMCLFSTFDRGADIEEPIQAFNNAKQRYLDASNYN